MNDWIRQFTLLWTVIDPIGTIPVFLAITAALDARERRRIAFAAVGVAGLVLLFFLIAGQFLLEGMGIPLSAFQIAGGVVLFIFALTMIFGEGKPVAELRLAAGNLQHVVYPLAIPSIASPGAMMAVVVLTDYHRFSIDHHLVTAGILAAVLFATLVLMLLATPIQRLIGNAGASIISRVMGLILASVATHNVLSGLEAYFGLHIVPLD